MAYARAYVIKKDASVEVDSVEFKSQLWRITLTPDTPTQTRRTFGGVDQDRDSTAWTADIAGYASRGTGSFAAAIDAAIAAGDNMEIVLQPKTGTGQDVVTFTILPTPLPFGGEHGEWNQFEMTFQVVDSPVFTQSA